MADSTRSSHTGPPPDPEWLANQIAHTLRNPIFAAMVQAEALMVKADTNEATARAIRLIHRQLKRLEANINEMLLYGRPTRLSPRQAELVSVVEQAVASLRSREREEPADVRFESSVPHLVVDLDPDAVKIIIERLVVNAIQHTPPPHKVQVGLDGDVGRNLLTVTVRDQGEGIPDSIKDEMFLPFYPQHSGRAGLGLSVASKFAHAIGGRIEIESEEGVGTTARCILPIEPRPTSS